MKKQLLFLLSLTIYSGSKAQLGPSLNAMGGGTTAVYDIWNIDANPAGISALEKVTIATYYSSYFIDTELNRQAIVIAVPTKRALIATSISRYGLSLFNTTSIGLALAKHFGHNFSVAVKLNYHLISIKNYGQTAGFSIDVGTIYKVNKYLDLGIQLNNPSKQQYNNSQINTDIPKITSIGIAYHPTTQIIVALAAERYQQEIDVKLGIAYQIIKVLTFRMGTVIKPFQHYAGFGLSYGHYNVDLAIENNNSLGIHAQIGISYAF